MIIFLLAWHFARKGLSIKELSKPLESLKAITNVLSL